MPPTDLSAVEWIHGAADCDSSADPPIQVVAYDEDTYVLRQSKCVNYEAPFLYLLVGTDTVLLHDTGATADPGLFPIRRTVDEIVAARGPRHGATPRLIVSHSHGHGDHRAGDGQFADLPAGSLAGIGAEEAAAFFGIADWPAGQATLDLGDRPIEVLPTPGHAPDHVRRFTAFDLEDGKELDDVCPGPPFPAVYHKSLLYFVARALEVSPFEFEAAMVGLHKSVTGPMPTDPTKSLLDLIGGDQNLIKAPTTEAAPLNARSKARGDADFDNDEETMTSVLLRILRKSKIDATVHVYPKGGMPSQPAR